MKRKDWKPRTKIVRAAIAEDRAYQAVIPPIYMTSTFQIDGIAQKGPYEYSRTRNPTRDQLADAVTELEGGYKSCVTSSGMAAITLILNLLKPNDLLLAPYDCYGRAYRLMATLAEKGHFRLKFIDQYDKKALKAAFAEEKPAIVFVESPSNPVMRIADMSYISKLCQEAKGKKPLLVADNTFLSPVLQRPIELGADIVTQSTTKFLNGHSDIVGGVVTAKSKKLWEELDFWSNSLGLIGAPFDSYMTLRGLRTLNLRIEKAQENAEKIAKFLAKHPKIDAVYYPGLPKHPGVAIAKKQQSGPGSMLSFTLKGGLPAVKKFVKKLEIFSLAQSLGGTESLVNHPATMTHISMGPSARAEAGVSDGLLRLSVGIEAVEDQLADLKNALSTL